MIRRIIEIDEEKCNGCGACASACHEGAIGIVNGKAKLLRDDYCDGLGDCLPACPTGAITFTEREAAAYDEKAVAENMKIRSMDKACSHYSCPGTKTRILSTKQPKTGVKSLENSSQLGQWPCQIKLVPTSAPYFDGANLLVAADCTAYAYANMHNEFMSGKITLIGCPKLDSVDYSEKLTAIFMNNNIRSVTVVRMEVPCCKGIEASVKKALKNSGKLIPRQIITVSVDGKLLDR